MPVDVLFGFQINWGNIYITPDRERERERERERDQKKFYLIMFQLTKS